MHYTRVAAMQYHCCVVYRQCRVQSFTIIHALLQYELRCYLEEPRWIGPQGQDKFGSAGVCMIAYLLQCAKAPIDTQSAQAIRSSASTSKPYDEKKQLSMKCLIGLVISVNCAWQSLQVTLPFTTCMYNSKQFLIPHPIVMFCQIVLCRMESHKMQPITIFLQQYSPSGIDTCVCIPDTTTLQVRQAQHR